MILLCVFLLVCHYFADYSHLSSKWMLRAKSTGSPVFPIFGHALIHGILMFSVLCVFMKIYRFPLRIMVDLSLVQIITHFLIDTWKGRMNVWFPSVSQPQNRSHWYLFGFDQLLHQLIIIFMAWGAFNLH